MGLKTLLVLALVVAGLGAFILFFERDLPSTDERRQRENLVLPIEVDQVTAVLLERDGGRTRLELGDEGAGWRLTEPLVARADDEEVRSLLNDLAGLRKVRTISDVEPAEVGLEDPRWRLTVTTGDGEWRLAIGSDIPATTDVVVAVEGGGTFVVANRFSALIARQPGDWRDRQVIPAAEIEEIRALTAGGELALVKQDDGFALTAPVHDEAEQERTSELLAALQDLEVEEFLDQGAAAADSGLDPPAYEIAVTIEGRDEPLVVRFGSAAEGEGLRYADADGQVFTVESDLPAILDLPSSSWQSLAWTRLEAFEIDSVRVAWGDIESELARVDGEWLRDGAPVPYSMASDLLDSIVAVRGERVIDSEAQEGEAADRTIASLVLGAAERTETLTIWPVGEDTFRAAREGRGYLLEVSAEVAASLFAAVESAVEPAADPGAGELSQD